MSDAEFFYMDAKVAARSMLLSVEESLEGQTLLSLETTEGSGDERVQDFLQADPEAFFRYLRRLRRGDQDLMLAYYFLFKTQTQLGNVCKLTQTSVSHCRR